MRYKHIFKRHQFSDPVQSAADKSVVVKQKGQSVLQHGSKTSGMLGLPCSGALGVLRPPTKRCA